MASPPRRTSEALPRTIESGPSAPARLAAATFVALGVVLGGPMVGALRGALLERWPAAYIPVLAGIVALCGLSLLTFSLVRLRRRSWRRIGAIGLAVAAAVSCAAAMRTGDTNVDVVEAFHFTEYSALALLFAWAGQPVAGGAAWAWAGYGGVLVGVLDEWLQWFVPGRTGEGRDVAMNAVAVGCGLVLAAALDLGPRAFARSQAAWLARGGAVVVLALAGFVGTVHLGHRIDDPKVGPFLSRYSAAELRTAATDRSRVWGDGAAPTPGRFGREDQYLAEALWHVRRRNRAVDDGPAEVAWREQQILQTYFAPALRLTTEDGPAGYDWPPRQAAAIRAAAGGAAIDRGDASPIPIYTWAHGVFGWCAAAVGVALLGLGRLLQWRERAGRQEVRDA